MLCRCVNTHTHTHTHTPGVVEDTRPDEGKVLVRPDMMKDQVVELELAEVQKKFNVSAWGLWCLARCVCGSSTWHVVA